MAYSTHSPIDLDHADKAEVTPGSLARLLPDRNRLYWLLGILFSGYAILSLNGYGNHDDIYRMLSTWRSLWSEHRYVSSRFQGYLVPELVIGASSQLGGYLLSNLVSAVLAVGSLYMFHTLLSRITTSLTALLATAVVGTNPYWVIAATTSTDYVYPAFLFLLGIMCLLHERFRFAGVLFALAVSARLTYGPMGVLVFCFYFLYLRQTARLTPRFFHGVILFFFFCGLLYLPVFVASGLSLSFLGFSSGTSGGTFGIIARFLYKNVYLWSLPIFGVLVIFLLSEMRVFWKMLSTNPVRDARPETLIFYAVLSCFLYTELLFARLPHQYQYLLPVLFCTMYFVAIVPHVQKRTLVLAVVVVLHIAYGIWNIEVLEKHQTKGIGETIHTDEANFRLSLNDGILVQDYKWRSIYQSHQVAKFNQRWMHYGQPLENPTQETHRPSKRENP
jgi:hypothetical protein